MTNQDQAKATDAPPLRLYRSEDGVADDLGKLVKTIMDVVDDSDSTEVGQALATLVMLLGNTEDQHEREELTRAAAGMAYLHTYDFEDRIEKFRQQALAAAFPTLNSDEGPDSEGDDNAETTH